MNLEDDFNGLQLYISLTTHNENGEEDSRGDILQMKISEDDRTSFAEYLRRAADMIERSRSWINEGQRSPVHSSSINLIIGHIRGTTMNEVYEIEGKYYTSCLRSIEFDDISVRYIIPLDLSILTSEPKLLFTSTGYILLMTDGNEIRIIDSSPDALNQPIYSTVHLEVPNLSGYHSGEELPNVLPKLDLPPFNDDRWNKIAGELMTRIRPPSYNEIFSPQSTRQSESNFTPFEQIALMLTQTQIERYIIDPSLQYLTETPNSILTIFGKNGITYLVKVRYDQPTNQIFPPV